MQLTTNERRGGVTSGSSCTGKSRGAVRARQEPSGVPRRVQPPRFPAPTREKSRNRWVPDQATPARRAGPNRLLDALAT
jgi:hypothetical protein